MRASLVALALAAFFVPRTSSALDGPYHVARARFTAGQIDDRSYILDSSNYLVRDGRLVPPRIPLSGLRLFPSGEIIGYSGLGGIAISRTGTEYVLPASVDPVSVDPNGTLYVIGFNTPVTWAGPVVRQTFPIGQTPVVWDGFGNAAGTQVVNPTSDFPYQRQALFLRRGATTEVTMPQLPVTRLYPQMIAQDGTVYGTASIDYQQVFSHMPFWARGGQVQLETGTSLPRYGIALKDGRIVVQRQDGVHLQFQGVSVRAEELLLAEAQRAQFGIESLTGQNNLGQISGWGSVKDDAGIARPAPLLWTPAHLVQPASSTTPAVQFIQRGQAVEFEVQPPAEGGPFQYEQQVVGDREFGYSETLDVTGVVEGKGTNRLRIVPSTSQPIWLRVRGFNRYQAEIFSQRFYTVVLEPGESPSAPRVSYQPRSTAHTVGNTVSISASFVSKDLTTLRLLRGDVEVGRSNVVPSSSIYDASATFDLGPAVRSLQGSYRVVATNSSGSTSTEPFQITVTDENTTRLANLSTRGWVGTDESAMIAGFAVRGGGKRLLVRAMGPSLVPFGVADALLDPSFEVFDAQGARLLANDNWGVNAAALQGTNLIPSDARESAAVLDLGEGTYTVVVRGVANTTGVALVEVYDLDPPSTVGRLSNLSTRAFVGEGSAVLIGGFVTTSGTLRPHVIRAIGPSLANYGIARPLADPNITVAFGPVPYTYDGWEESSTLLRVSGLRPSSPLEAAVADYPSGAKTVIVRGAPGQTGVALIEIYEMY